MMTEITVLIPCYNMQDSVVSSVESVLNQDIDACIIIVDDHSQTPLELPAWMMESDRLRLIRHDQNLGVSAARNCGIKECQTDWLTFLDADDVLLPGTLALRLDFAKQAVLQSATDRGVTHETALASTLVGCGWIHPDHQENNKFQIRIPNPASKPEQFASGCWYSPGSCVISHRSAFAVKQRYFDENLRRFEDLDWGIKFGLSGGQLLTHPIAGVAIRPSNRTNARAIEKASTQILENLNRSTTDDKSILRSLKAYLALEKATFYFRDKRWLSAAAETVRTFVLRPRTSLHFSPGWTYKTWQGSAKKSDRFEK